MRRVALITRRRSTLAMFRNRLSTSAWSWSRFAKSFIATKCPTVTTRFLKNMNQVFSGKVIERDGEIDVYGGARCRPEPECDAADQRERRLFLPEDGDRCRGGALEARGHATCCSPGMLGSGLSRSHWSTILQMRYELRRGCSRRNLEYTKSRPSSESSNTMPSRSR